MPKIIEIVQLFPIVLAFAAALVAFILGAKPVPLENRLAPEKKLRHVFRERPFLLSPVPVASLITVILAAIAIFVKPLTGDAVLVDPMVSILLPSPTTTPTHYVTETIVGISIAPKVETPTPTHTPSPTPIIPAPEPAQPITFTVIVTQTKVIEVPVPERTVIPTATPAALPIPSPSSLIPKACVDNGTALHAGQDKDKFGFLQPQSHGEFQSFTIKLPENALYYTIRYAREDNLPRSTEINDWKVPWPCMEVGEGQTRCQRPKPSPGEANDSREITPAITWPKENTTYVFLLQLETTSSDLCAYIYNVH